MTINGTKVESAESLDQLIADMPDTTKQFLKDLYAAEQAAEQSSPQQ